MTKYLQNIIERFEELKNGVSINREKWNSFPDTPETIDEQINEIRKMDFEIEETKKLLSEKQSEARKLRDEKKSRIAIIEKRAFGIHADEEDKLENYKIKKGG